MTATVPVHPQYRRDTQTALGVDGLSAPDSQAMSAAHPHLAVGDGFGGDHDRFDAQAMRVPAEDVRPPTSYRTLPKDASSEVALVIYADLLDDLERVRIATENRVRSLAQVKGMDGTKEQALLDELTGGLGDLEKRATRLLQRSMKDHPLGAFVASMTGVGEKQAGRLLAAIGDPYWHAQQDRPRTVSELWAYCGLHVIHDGSETQRRCDDGEPGSHTDHTCVSAQRRLVGVAPVRKRGEKANWNAVAKSRTFLIAESCIKQVGSQIRLGTTQARHAADAVENDDAKVSMRTTRTVRRRSPYRDIYDTGRAKYADAVHPVACKRCGPAGKPAQPGSELSDGHKHARAMRLVMKAILKDLWLAARDLHEADAEEKLS